MGLHESVFISVFVIVIIKLTFSSTSKEQAYPLTLSKEESKKEEKFL